MITKLLLSLKLDSGLSLFRSSYAKKIEIRDASIKHLDLVSSRSTGGEGLGNAERHQDDINTTMNGISSLKRFVDLKISCY